MMGDAGEFKYGATSAAAEQGATWIDATSAVGSVVAALGTLAAVAVAVGIAVVETRRARSANDRLEEIQRTAVSGLVSAWVEEEHIPSDDGTSYVRRARVHLANEANEPVFNVHLSVVVGFPDGRHIGPLSVPENIPVLPPRRELSWDITIPLRAHEGTHFPRAAMGFTDSAGRRWLRESDGSLSEATSTGGLLPALQDDPEKVEEQIGRSDLHNPMAVALAFLAVLSEEDPDVDVLRPLLDPEARGWSGLGPEDVRQMRADLGDYGVAGFVRYPASHVARVVILPAHVRNLKIPSGQPVPIPDGATSITLTYTADAGWRVFGYGAAVEADRIPFRAGALFEI